MKLEYFKAADLDCAALEPREPGDYPLVILLHGLGDVGDSYIDVGAAISTTKYRFVMPTAPLPVPGAGFSWFDFGTNFTDFARRAATARGLLFRLIGELRQRYNTPTNRIVVGGFSQGGMMTLDGGMRYKDENGQRLAGLIALSTLLPADDPATIHDLEQTMQEVAQAQIPVYMAHGTLDQVIPVRAGRASRDLLKKAGVNLEYFEFTGFHELQMEELEQISAFLNRVV